MHVVTSVKNAKIGMNRPINELSQISGKKQSRCCHNGHWERRTGLRPKQKPKPHRLKKSLIS